MSSSKKNAYQFDEARDKRRDYKNRRKGRRRERRISRRTSEKIYRVKELCMRPHVRVREAVRMNAVEQNA